MAVYLSRLSVYSVLNLYTPYVWYPYVIINLKILGQLRLLHVRIFNVNGKI